MGRKEALTTKALYSIVDKMEQFDEQNVTRYLRIYRREIELSKIGERVIVASFEFAMVPEIRGHI